jgi:glycosyltransferase involved in cell wall biosynthesis
MLGGTRALMENPVMPPLRIAIVTDTFAPDINGVAMSLGRLCAGLRERGHQVQVIRSGRGGDVAVPWWPLPGYWEIRVGAPWPGQFRRLWQRDRPDIVYVAIETPLGFSAMRAAEKLGIPVVGGFHTNFREYLCDYGMPRFAGRVWRYQKWFHSRLACTLVPSPDARRKLLEAGFLNVEVLGRGVDTELFHPAKRSEALRREWGVADGVPVALVVGRVSPEKNIGLAIRAFERMRAACPELACVVVGDGPVRARLEREHPSVKFTGYRTGEELAACYASADILLFPSETETFGNVLLEGMASGLAVLAYDDAAAAWHGRHRENLLKVAKALESAFLDAAVELLDPALRATLGTAARQTSESLAWPAITAELERIFQRHIPAQP